MHRSHTCGELTHIDIEKEVIIAGWVDSIRDHGGVIFIDLRDRYGITQIKVDPDTSDADIMAITSDVRDEFVLKVTGLVKKRPDGTENTQILSGYIEIIPSALEILSTSNVLPLQISQENQVGEEIRLQYKYLDLRRKRLATNLQARSNLTYETLQYFQKEGFLYIETPNLVKNTPEGAREYIVPDRRRPGSAYVLPQSPQQLKQLLMVAGCDKYVQLARCFRDEDLRGDRQPEFSQIDVEMSFVEQEDILQLMERYFIHITSTLYPEKNILNDSIARLTYQDSIYRYGIDKPERRTEKLTIQNISDFMLKADFKVFSDAVKNNGSVVALVSDKIYSRGEIDKLTSRLQEKGAKGLAYIVRGEAGPVSPILKFFSEEQKSDLYELLGLAEGKMVFFQAGESNTAHELLGLLRSILIEEQGLTQSLENTLAYSLVTDFPMFEVDEETGSIAAAHHPFTKPHDADIPYVLELAEMIAGGHTLTKSEIDKIKLIRSDCYDMVLNGYEIVSGSIRIHEAKLQKAIFTIFGMSDKTIDRRFGHMIRAFGYGVPPHGGFAIGFDRLLMILQNEPNIREIIPFPKNQKGEDLMLGSPTTIDKKLLDELNLQVKESK